ncbi:hypothetical protein ACI2KE_08045 [Pseudomonas monteilii]
MKDIISEDFLRKSTGGQLTRVASFGSGLLARAWVGAVTGALTPFLVVLGTGRLITVQKFAASKGYDEEAEEWLDNDIDEVMDEMTNLYNPDPVSVKKGPLAVVAFALLSGLLGPINFPESGWLYGVFSIALLVLLVYLTYKCERFTVYALSLSIVGIGSIAFAASGLAYIIAFDDLNQSRGEAATVGFLMLLAVVGFYALIYFTRAKAFPFLISGNRVSPVKVRPTPISAGFISGIGTLVSAAFINSVMPLTSGAVASVGLFLACIALLMYDRDSIRGLRTLRAKERHMSEPFTFNNIDAIREARGRWLLGRLFK